MTNRAIAPQPLCFGIGGGGDSVTSSITSFISETMNHVTGKNERALAMEMFKSHNHNVINLT